MKVCRVNEIREIDKRAIAEFGIPPEILMENAGNAVYSVIRQEVEIEGRNFLVFCGPGNNGGDGFVIARLLAANGADVSVFTLIDTDIYSGAAKRNLEILSRFGVKIDSSRSLPKIKRALQTADYVVDALLGTGIDRPADGIFKDVIGLINKGGKKVFAVDISSGINGDTGQEMGVSVKADYTVTFGLPKVGNLLYPGYGRGGKLYVSSISLPVVLTEIDSLQIEVPEPVALPPRSAGSNKLDYGPALVIAGAANYYWAPYASAYSFLKSGGGYVHLACPASLTKTIARRGKEIVFQPQAETKSGSIAYENKAALLKLARKMKIVVIGPGLSLDAETQQLTRELISEIDLPLIIDGDGITAVAGQTEILLRRKAPSILTPHTGEMSRLTGTSPQIIESDRTSALRETTSRLKAIIVLKGPHSLTGYPEGKIKINMSGRTGDQAGMATAGAGDILNGIIAAVYCLGVNMEKAVYTGVFIHGLAGDLAAAAHGADGMTAADILEELPRALKLYRADLTRLAANCYQSIFTV